MRILVATDPVDFRKGIDGLAAICRKPRHEEWVKAEPACWLPWNNQEQLAESFWNGALPLIDDPPAKARGRRGLLRSPRSPASAWYPSPSCRIARSPGDHPPSSGSRFSVGFYGGGSLVPVRDRDRPAGRDRFVIGWRAMAAQPSAKWPSHRWRPRAFAEVRQSTRSKRFGQFPGASGPHSTNSGLADWIGVCVGGNSTAELPAGVYQLPRSFVLPSVTRHFPCRIDRPATFRGSFRSSCFFKIRLFPFWENGHLRAFFRRSQHAPGELLALPIVG